MVCLVILPWLQSCSLGQPHAFHYSLCKRFCKWEKTHHIWIFIWYWSEYRESDLNSLQQLRFPAISTKSAKIAKTVALFHFRLLYNWVSLPYLRQELKSTRLWSMIVHADWPRRATWVTDQATVIGSELLKSIYISPLLFGLGFLNASSHLFSIDFLIWRNCAPALSSELLEGHRWYLWNAS